MKIWVDDIRIAPDETWVWFKTSKDAITELDSLKFFSGRTDRSPALMSLDHDLGGDDTTRPIVLWMCENKFWPIKTVVHSANPPGALWLRQMIDRYGP